MKRSRVTRLLVWLGLIPTAFGCAQVAGLNHDYQLGDLGAAGVVESSGGTGPSGGASPSGGSVGSSRGGHPSGGDVGANGGAAGASGSAAGSLGVAGGTGGSGGAGVAGAGAGAGAGGGAGAAKGPVRIGVSEFHDSAAGNDNASSRLVDATFAKPPGTAQGDFLLVFFGDDHNLSNLSGNNLSPGGWTLLDQHEGYGKDGQGTYLIYKFAGAAEPDPIVFTGINPAGSGNGVQGLLSVYRGVNKLSPINAYEVTVFPTGQEAVTQAVTATPAITTTAANCLLIAGLSPDSAIDAPVITSWPQGFVTNQVSVINPAHPYPFGWANIYSAERLAAAAGTVPASAFAWTMTNATAYYGSLAFVLALAP